MKCIHKYILISIIFVLILLFGFATYHLNKHTYPVYNSIHIHADFAIYIDGIKITFDNDLYQSTDKVARHQFQHLHDNQGEVLHIHAKKQSIGDFFSSLGLYLKEDCLYLQPKDTKLCSEDGLKLFVNDKKYKNKYSSYVPKDLDKFLLTNSTQKEEIEKQINNITNKACIHSKKCENTTDENIIESCSIGSDGCARLPKVVPITHTHKEIKKEVKDKVIETKPKEAKVACVIAGCSGTLCLDKESASDIVTTCEFKSEYECYKQVSCEIKDSGNCGWSDREKLSECIEKKKEY